MLWSLGLICSLLDDAWNLTNGTLNRKCTSTCSARCVNSTTSWPEAQFCLLKVGRDQGIFEDQEAQGHTHLILELVGTRNCATVKHGFAIRANGSVLEVGLPDDEGDPSPWLQRNALLLILTFEVDFACWCRGAKVCRKDPQTNFDTDEAQTLQCAHISSCAHGCHQLPCETFGLEPRSDHALLIFVCLLSALSKR